MGLYRHTPAPPLNCYVDFFWYYMDLLPDHDREYVLPDGTFELIINLQDTVRKLFHRVDAGSWEAFKRGWISGAQWKFLIIDALPLSSMIGVHFKPGGAATVLGLPASELAGRVIELDAVWGDTVWDWREQLLEALTPAAKFATLERLLTQKLHESRKPSNNAIAWALSQFLTEPGLPTITSVLSKVGFSHKHFIELFRRETALSPKLFCRVRRFQQVLIEIQTRPEINWADIACSCGYFDQSHFVHDFFESSGVNPSAYLDRRVEGERNFIRAA
jgi:AraC-like DNA-binding protein